ncbi:hypothetical protein [Pedobacter steynii]
MATSYPKFSLAETLTAEQKDFFNTNGFIHFKNFITPDTVKSIVDASLEVQKNGLKKM